MRSPKMKELVKKDDYFKTFYFDFCLDMIDIYKEVKFKDPLLRQMLEAPTIFEGVVTILVRELRRNPIKLFLLHKPTRKRIMLNILDALKAEITKEKLVPLTLAEIIITLPIIELKLDYKELKDVLKADEISKKYADTVQNYKLNLKAYHKFCDHLWRPEETRKYSFPRFKGFNTGALLWGPRGVGKSQILAYLGAWAHDNNWATILVPSGSKLARGMDRLVQHGCGLYMQPEYAKQILEGIQKTNEKLFAEIPVNMSLYGNYNLAGWDERDPPPVVREYDPKRQVWSDHWKSFFSEEQLKFIQSTPPGYEGRITNSLATPKTLLDIANLGLSNPAYATVCIAEILEQLYNTDKCNVLIASDDYNEWFDKSGYMSYQHAFKKEYDRRIPPYDIALVRLFMKFDGHLIRNGVKIAATSQKNYFNHVCKPEMINFPVGYAVETGPLALNDFRKVCKYYNAANWCFKRFQEWEMEALYAMSQGNWYHFQSGFRDTTLLKC